MLTCVYPLICRLVTEGLPEGHFTHVFVDEAGHAAETECLIPMAGKENKEHHVSTIVLNVLYVLIFVICATRAAPCKDWSGCSGWRPQADRTCYQMPFCTKLWHGCVQTHSHILCPIYNTAIWVNDDTQFCS